MSRTEAVLFTPLDGDASWEGNWEISDRGADPSQAGSLAGTDRVTLPFTGTGLALQVRRGSYRAYLWVSVDGEPASRLPQAERGAYLVLSSPDYEPQVITIPVAGGLENGAHVAEVVADRGWDQWPLVGWRVTQGPDPTPYDRALRALLAVAMACLFGAVAGRAEDGFLQRPIRGERGRSPDIGSDAIRQVRRQVPRVSADLIGSLQSPLASVPSFLSVAIVTGVFYVSPWLPLTLVSGAALAVLILLRLDLGLALVAFSAPFYLHPKPLLGKSFSMVEIATLLCLLSWAVRCAGADAARRPQSPISSLRHPRLTLQPPSTLDLAVLFLVLAAAVSTLFADYGHVALRELRVAIVEPALLYMILRTTELRRKAVWRIADAFVVGAVAVALIGLMQYVLDVNVITAEQGFRRLRSVYGSPNNAALYLGRALPMQLAGMLLAAKRRRRILYGASALPVALALVLSFSRGALLLGVPLSLLVLGALARMTDGPILLPWIKPKGVGPSGTATPRVATAGRRWRWIALIAVALAAVGVIALLSTPRFAGLLDPHSGTLFFRLQLWRGSWKMFRDHPWLGVGPDNFLYQYRGRYILPSAWQEPHLSHAHNLLLSYATRLGVVGLTVGIGLQVAFWRRALALRRTVDRDGRALALGLMGSMAYALGHGLVDASTFFVDLAFAFLLTLGLVESLLRSKDYGQKD
ncbi:MAG: O-antigen ligase family protein [Anaerolineae bacterium]|jgi:O-antigen ligase